MSRLNRYASLGLNTVFYDLDYCTIKLLWAKYTCTSIFICHFFRRINYWSTEKKTKQQRSFIFHYTDVRNLIWDCNWVLRPNSSDRAKRCGSVRKESSNVSKRFCSCFDYFSQMRALKGTSQASIGSAVHSRFVVLTIYEGLCITSSTITWLLIACTK